MSSDAEVDRHSSSEYWRFQKDRQNCLKASTNVLGESSNFNKESDILRPAAHSPSSRASLQARVFGKEVSDKWAPSDSGNNPRAERGNRRSTHPPATAAPGSLPCSLFGELTLCDRRLALHDYL